MLPRKLVHRALRVALAPLLTLGLTAVATAEEPELYTTDWYGEETRFDEYAGSGEAIDIGDPGAARAARKLSGEILDLKTVRLLGVASRHVLAKVETDEGKLVKVDLGPREVVDRLRLRRGDAIDISGVAGKINGRPFVFARRIEADGEVAEVPLSRMARLERLTGQVLGTEKRTLGGEEHVFARVRLTDGETVLVGLGIESDLAAGELLEKGDEIRLLARPVATEPMYAAERVRHDGRTFVVDDTLDEPNRQRALKKAERKHETTARERRLEPRRDGGGSGY